MKNCFKKQLKVVLIYCWGNAAVTEWKWNCREEKGENDKMHHPQPLAVITELRKKASAMW